jgi:hypothetical protein
MMTAPDQEISSNPFPRIFGCMLALVLGIFFALCVVAGGPILL